jgi:large subunit ribosomal protein L33
MAKKSKGKILILLMNKESGYHYVAWKDPKKGSTKLSFRKYDPVLRKHAIFTETKLVH